MFLLICCKYLKRATKKACRGVRYYVYDLLLVVFDLIVTTTCSCSPKHTPVQRVRERDVRSYGSKSMGPWSHWPECLFFGGMFLKDKLSFYSICCILQSVELFVISFVILISFVDWFECRPSFVTCHWQRKQGPRIHCISGVVANHPPVEPRVYICHWFYVCQMISKMLYMIRLRKCVYVPRILQVSAAWYLGTFLTVLRRACNEQCL